jgi:glycosyltransferase involved in cell wall biosynthesis
MRVLLTSNASHHPPKGGSTRSNLAWARNLAERGHEVAVVCPTDGHAPDFDATGNGMAIHAFADLSTRSGLLAAKILDWRPDWVLVSSEDVSHVLLREAARVAPDRLIYLAHTPQFYPFGPESWNPDPAATALVRRARAVIAIGHHMRGYIQQHAGVEARVVHPPMYGAPPWPLFGRTGDGFVLMINPCAVKGLGIFLEMARRFPEVPFAGLAGWGTTAQDRALMAALPNVQVLETVPSIDDVLREARVVLMPSVWYEGFGLIAMEAMLRGVPVISSDSGGLKEAKRGTGYVLPVRPVERYEREYDDTGMPRAVVPEQDLAPWTVALRELLEDHEAYRAEAARARECAIQFVRRLDVADFARTLEIMPVSKSPLLPPIAARPLDAARRALLLGRLRKKQA